MRGNCHIWTDTLAFLLLLFVNNTYTNNSTNLFANQWGKIWFMHMSQIVESSFNNYRGMSAKPGFYTASYKLYSIWRRSAVGEKEAETIHPRRRLASLIMTYKEPTNLTALSFSFIYSLIVREGTSPTELIWHSQGMNKTKSAIYRQWQD